MPVSKPRSLSVGRSKRKRGITFCGWEPRLSGRIVFAQRSHRRHWDDDEQRVADWRSLTARWGVDTNVARALLSQADELWQVEPRGSLRDVFLSLLQEESGPAVAPGKRARSVSQFGNPARWARAKRGVAPGKRVAISHAAPTAVATIPIACHGDGQVLNDSIHAVSSSTPMSSTTWLPTGGIRWESRRFARFTRTDAEASPGARIRAFLMPKVPDTGSTLHVRVSLNDVARLKSMSDWVGPSGR